MSHYKKITAQPGSTQYFSQVKDSVNSLIDHAKAFDNLSLRGPAGSSLRKSRNSISITLPKKQSLATGALILAQVQNPLTGGGYYNCYLIDKYQAANWDSGSSLFAFASADTEVLNITEDGTNSHNLNALDLILCWQITDDAEEKRYIGFEWFGKISFGEW